MIAHSLRNELNSRNMTLRELSDLTDIPYETLRNIYYDKVNNPKLSTIVSVCDALNLPVDYILNRKPFCKDEIEIIQNYRCCGNHGKQVIALIAKVESKLSKEEREKRSKHKIICLVPVDRADDGMMYSSCTVDSVYTSVKEAYMAIEITSNYFAPAYCKHDRILLANRFPHENERAVFLKEDIAYFRRYVSSGKKSYILRCLNGRGKDIIFSRMDECICLGTCINVIRAE